MNGRISVAPCGHTGETIIGTYVKCLVGCDGQVAKPHRGELGHVNTCTCFGCRVRRSVTHIQLRTRKGLNYLEIPWNGMGNELKVDTKAGLMSYIASYRMVNGTEVLAQGALEDTFLEPKQEITLDLDNFLKCARDGVPTKVKVETKSDLVIQKITIIPGSAPGFAAPLAAPAAISANWIKTQFETGVVVNGIKTVDVKLNAKGEADITIREFSIPHTPNWKTEQAKITTDAQYWCNLNIASTHPVVLDRSPAYSMDYAAVSLPTLSIIFKSKTTYELLVEELVRIDFADKAAIVPALVEINTATGKKIFELTWHGQKWSVTV